jgi:hypothetical protein
MNAPLLVMLGVAGIGAFAVYKLAGTSSSSPQTTAPGVALLPQNAPLSLQQGVHYQGRLILEAVDVPPLSSTKEQLTQFLQLLGFRDVAVYMTKDNLPFNWSEMKTGGPSNRWFEGTSNATVTVPRPKQLDRLSGNGSPLISGMTG